MKSELDNLSLKISPNPAYDNIEISLTTNDCSSSNLKIYDLSGRMVQDLSQNLINFNSQSLKVNLSNLSNGEYTIILNCGNLKVSEKLIILK